MFKANGDKAVYECMGMRRDKEVLKLIAENKTDKALRLAFKGFWGKGK